MSVISRTRLEKATQVLKMATRHRSSLGAIWFHDAGPPIVGALRADMRAGAGACGRGPPSSAGDAPPCVPQRMGAGRPPLMLDARLFAVVIKVGNVAAGHDGTEITSSTAAIRHDGKEHSLVDIISADDVDLGRDSGRAGFAHAPLVESLPAALV